MSLIYQATVGEDVRVGSRKATLLCVSKEYGIEWYQLKFRHGIETLTGVMTFDNNIGMFVLEGIDNANG